MSTSASTIERDAGGRFIPGQSGNPAGKAPGTRNRATLLRELMAEDEEREIGRVVIDKAKAGDAVAARFVIGHLYPRPRARTIALDVAAGLSPTNVVAAHDAVLRALFAGEIAPDEAEAITRVLDARMRALQAHGKEESERQWNPDFPTMRPRQAPMSWDDDEDDDVEEDEEAPAPVAAPTGAQSKGASPANGLHPCASPHPDPPERLSKGPEGEGGGGLPASGHAPADTLTQPSPSVRGQDEGAAPSAPPPAPLHSACIQPSPATIAGRRRVAEAARRQWIREMTG